MGFRETGSLGSLLNKQVSWGCRLYDATLVDRLHILRWVVQALQDWHCNIRWTIPWWNLPSIKVPSGTSMMSILGFNQRMPRKNPAANWSSKSYPATQRRCQNDKDECTQWFSPSNSLGSLSVFLVTLGYWAASSFYHAGYGLRSLAVYMSNP